MVTPIKVNDRPLYAQAVDVLRGLIGKEGYEPGDRLPPEIELANELGISRTTLRVAMGTLEREGLIVRRQGLGTFVTDRSPAGLRGGLQFLQTLQSLAEEAGLEAETSEREVSVVAASAEWAEMLRVDAATALNRVQYTIAVAGQCVASIDTLVPETTISLQELAARGGSLLTVLLERTEIELSYTHSQIYAVEADASLARRLSVGKGKALLHLVETYFDRKGKPIALSYNHFVTDRFSFYIGRMIMQ
jgi:GntR family transcriptional regulator